MYIISVGTDYCHAYAYSADDGEPGYDQESLPVSSFAENPIEGKFIIGLTLKMAMLFVLVRVPARYLQKMNRKWLNLRQKFWRKLFDNNINGTLCKR